LRNKRKSKEKEPSSNNYFAAEKPIEFISTGCQILDCALGGGVAEGRVSNIVGNKSSGKTLLAIELSANFYQKHGDGGDINYHEAESAFDKPYAAALGMPVEAINFAGEDDPKNDNTVEYFYELLEAKIAELKVTKKPCLWITDSLDALTDRAELDRAIDEGSYGGNKPKKMSELFRRLIVQMGEVNLTLVIISQIRDKVGATFGKKTTRSGGKALDFYASQILFIVEISKLRKVFRKVKRVYGINVKATCEKNKVGLPFREADYSVLFGYGIDDITSSLNWLSSVGALEELDIAKKDIGKVAKLMIEDPDSEFIAEVKKLVKDVWKEIEVGFLPKGKKY
jgi:recombination protein RecA